MNKTSSTQPAVLALQQLRVSMGARTLVHGLDLQIAAGEILGLVGESGSGKSLTALSILGLLPAGARREGRILLQGLDLTQQTEPALNRIRGRDIGMVFQEPMTALNPLMPVADQVAEGLRLHHGLGRQAALEQAAQWLERVGVPAAGAGLKRYPHQLSGGQRQRVAIAMALILKPRLLIADEPTTALDVSTQAQVLQLLRSLVREEGCALLLVTHDLGVVAELADRVAVMRQGRLVEEGATLSLLSHPRQAYTQTLVQHSRLPRGTAPRAPLEAPPLLELRSLVREYRLGGQLFSPAQRLRAVDEVSLQLQAGEIVGLVGESGCGKSSLLRCILGLDAPQAGEVRLLGQRFTGRETALRRVVQIVFQDPYGSFDPRWRVWQLVAEPLHLLGSRPDPQTCRERVGALLEQVGLSAADAERYPHEFSGGQRQRIAMARALILEPALIVLDEAVSALDVSVRAQILALLAQLSRDRGIACLFVSHDLGVVRSITERVYVMERGRIVESGATQAVFERPRHACTARLLAATPDLDRALAARRARRDAVQDEVLERA